MTSPFIFIGTYEFQPGKAEDFKTYWKEFWSTVVEPQEPRLLAFNAYVDGDNKRVTVVQVHPDAESMAVHMSLITEHVAKAYGELLEPGGDHQIYGIPGPELLAAMRQMKGSEDTGAEWVAIGGFSRMG
jgi:hypothetical protein